MSTTPTPTPTPTTTETEPKEKTLNDFTGTRSEQIAQKTAFINKWGLDAFEKLVNSTPRKK